MNIFLDFDDTIVNSSKAFCALYNDIHSHDKGFVYADWKQVTDWGYKSQCTLIQGWEVNSYFESNSFFSMLPFMDNTTGEVIRELCSKHNVHICSIGTARNIALKSIWIAENLPYVDNVILLKNKGTKMNKSVVNMESGLMIDDVASNLDSSNALHKICFRPISRDYNKDYPVAIREWSEVLSLV